MQVFEFDLRSSGGGDRALLVTSPTAVFADGEVRTNYATGVPIDGIRTALVYRGTKPVENSRLASFQGAFRPRNSERFPPSQFPRSFIMNPAVEVRNVQVGPSIRQRVFGRKKCAQSKRGHHHCC